MDWFSRLPASAGLGFGEGSVGAGDEFSAAVGDGCDGTKDIDSYEQVAILAR